MIITKDFFTIAHRGASGYRPENTIESFRYAWELGAKHIECDLRYTKDNRIVIFHDDCVDRTTDGFGRLEDYTYEELIQLDAGKWFKPEYSGVRIPLLEELFEAAPKDALFTLELKDPDISRFVNEVIDYIYRYNVEDKVCVSSFNIKHLEEVHLIAPKLTLAALLNYNKEDESTVFLSQLDKNMKDLHLIGVKIMCPPAWSLSSKVVDLIHDRNYLVRAWGLSKQCNIDEMRTLIDARVDGMTTNFPDVLLRTLHHNDRGK
jgi:glycerophosphoryl diester phosphodiesterase